MLSFYRCPLCSLPLASDNTRWFCTNKHSFDIAKQGYIHLLPVQRKKSKAPGDDAHMVSARESFLSAGYYDTLRQGIVDTIAPLKPKHLLDVGCGEGFYTAAFANAAQHITALDIAKSAVQKTAKKTPDHVQSVIASAAHLPLVNNCVDLLTSIFSPIIPEEFNRVLHSTGKLIIAKPAEKHLMELRTELFDDVILHDSDKFIEQLSGAFELEHKQRIESTLSLSHTAINQLLTMTPYAYKAKPEKRHALAQLDSLKVTARFYVYVFQKKHT